jgi:deoxyguanosine kinase
VSRPFYLAIEGVIGVGKTTLARLLQPRLDADLLLEVFEENPFLADFYSDRERYAFQTQIFFLLSRYRQQQALRLGNHRPLITDYTFAKDRLFAHLNLQRDELTMYERVHRALAERVTLPDLVVYLQANLKVLMARIATRDRPYERAMDPVYIESVRQAYEQHFAHYEETPLLVINTDDLDFVRNPEDLAYVEGRVRTALSAAEVRSRLEMATGGTSDARSRRWPLVEEFLALTEAVGALGAVLSADPEGASAALREALVASRECLQRMEEGMGEGMKARA